MLIIRPSIVYRIGAILLTAIIFIYSFVTDEPITVVDVGWNIVSAVFLLTAEVAEIREGMEETDDE